MRKSPHLLRIGPYLEIGSSAQEEVLFKEPNICNWWQIWKCGEGDVHTGAAMRRQKRQLCSWNEPGTTSMGSKIIGKCKKPRKAREGSPPRWQKGHGPADTSPLPQYPRV